MTSISAINLIFASSCAYQIVSMLALAPILPGLWRSTKAFRRWNLLHHNFLFHYCQFRSYRCLQVGFTTLNKLLWGFLAFLAAWWRITCCQSLNRLALKSSIVSFSLLSLFPIILYWKQRYWALVDIRTAIHQGHSLRNLGDFVVLLLAFHFFSF